MILCEKGWSIPVSLSDQPILTYTFDSICEKTTYHFVKVLREWGYRVFDIECDNKGKYIAFADAHRLFEKGEYSACIVSAYSELEYQISLRNKDYQAGDYGSVNQIFSIRQYLNRNFESNNKDTCSLMELCNKIVHQRYVATKEEARDFLHLVMAVNEEIRKMQE